MTVGARIKQARTLRGMARPDLADKAGIKYPTLAGIENADQGSSTQLHAIASALGVRVEWLATGKKPIEAPSVASSQPARLDPDIVASAFDLLRGSYAKRGKEYDAARDPDLFVFAYEFLAEHEGEASPQNLIDFGQRLAERMRAKEDADGEQGKAGRTGSADRGARRRGAAGKT